MLHMSIMTQTHVLADGSVIRLPNSHVVAELVRRQRRRSSSSHVVGVMNVPEHGRVEFHKPHHHEYRADKVLPKDGPKLGLPSAAIMKRLVEDGLHSADFWTEDGAWAPMISHAGSRSDARGIGDVPVFHGWTRTGS